MSLKKGTAGKGMKQMLALALAGVMVFGSAVTTEAATLKDVFDAQYYSETYSDLNSAFGTNKTALYKHYRTTGKAEGRNATALIDVQKYKDAYPDLAAAFGDNWDAYVNHYIKYGFNEGRNSFGTFDARAYADRYPDLKEAFGYDVLALYKHYMNYGRAEGRNASAVVASVPTVTYRWDGFWPGDSEATDSNTNTDSSTNTNPVTTVGRLVNSETGAPVPNATIRFTRSTFNALSEIVEGTETTEATEATETTEATESTETTETTEATEATETTETTEATEATETTEATESTVVVGDGYYEVTTDANGYYTVPNFEPGVYSVEATAEGYLSLTLNSIEINSDAGAVTMPTFQLLSADGSGTNTVTGTVVDATTGTGIANATLNVRSNWNNVNGDVVATASTSADGSYSVDLVRGYYTIEFVVDGYSSTFVNVASSNAVGPMNGVLNPTNTTTEVDSTQFRIVLTWGETPRDLDSHLVGPSADGGCFHVCYYDKVYTENGENVASLDVDDVSSYGPETVTIVNANPDAVYYYSVKNYSNQSATSMTMSESGANVKVYQGSVLVAEYNVPLNQAGYIWNVFKIENGRVVTINNYGADENTMYGHYDPSTVY